MVQKHINATTLGAALALLACLPGVAQAVVIINSSRNVAPGGAVHDPHDPSSSGAPDQFVASSSDLAQGLTATVTYVGGDGSTMEEESAGESVWTDGSITTVYGENGSAGDATDHAAYGTVNGTVGTNDVDTFVTFDLLSAFDLARIDVFTGWNDSGRDDSSFNLLVSSDNVSFSQIASYDKGGDNTGTFTTPVTNRHSIVDDGAGTIATGIQYVQFQFTDADNGFAGLVELDIFDPLGINPPGDANKDGDVDINDFILISNNFFTVPSANGLDGDVTEDNFVDAEDFRLWKNNAPASALAAWAQLTAPEPTSLAAMAIASIFGFGSRRWRSA